MILHPKRLSGCVAAPPSKSDAHRAVLCAALAQGRSTVQPVELSDDIQATIAAVRALGAQVHISLTGDGLAQLTITGAAPDLAAEPVPIDCGESGSTLRFLVPISLAMRGGARFTGKGRLGERPMGAMRTLLTAKGIAWQPTAGLLLRISGHLQPGAYSIDGGESSQHITGLLLALSLLGAPSTVQIQGELQSAGYVDMTLCALQAFGGDVRQLQRHQLYAVHPAALRACAYTVQGDWSQAAILAAMGCIGGGIAITGLDEHSPQADRRFISLAQAMGARLHWQGDVLHAQPGTLHAADADIAQCPDLAPALAALMTLAQGTSRMTGIERLRTKESDRAQAIYDVVTALGGRARLTADALVIQGVPSLHGGAARAHGDHRIAMLAAALSQVCRSTVVLDDPQCVAKSWPGFWHAFAQLGGITQ